MKLYIYNDIENVSGRYHDSGGVIIATSGSPDRAWREYINSLDMPYRDTDLRTSLKDEAPDRILDVTDTPEFVQVFPDAGCC